MFLPTPCTWPTSAMYAQKESRRASARRQVRDVLLLTLHGVSGRAERQADPLGARVIAVCDAFSAMTTERPWRQAMSHGEALARLREEAGTVFDPAVVAAFESALSSGPTRSTDRAGAR